MNIFYIGDNYFADNTAGLFFLLGFGAWLDVLLQILLDSFLSSEPVPTDLDPFDLTFPQEFTQMAGCQPANLGSFRH